MDAWKKLKQTFPGEVKEGISFSNLTTVNIGGPIKGLITVKTPEEFIRVLQFATKENLPYLIIGGGSNILASDKGTDKLVIKNEVSGINRTDDCLLVQSGTILQALVDYTIANSLGGLNKLAGIPGTVGGAIYGNAGAYGQMIGNYISEVTAFSNGKLLKLANKDCLFGYRESGFRENNFVILEACFKLPNTDSESLAKEAQECLSLRDAKYNHKTSIHYTGTLKCPGSFFKNFWTKDIPKNALELLPKRQDTFGKTPAYIFLEELGAKGDKIGNIQIAPDHANLFINLGEGTAEDFWKLALKWYKKVKEKYGVKLQPEVQLIDLPPIE